MGIRGRFLLGLVLVGSLLGAMLLLNGCGTLGALLTEAQDIAATGEANPQIEATLTIVDDLINNPWDNFLAVGVGYGLALLRRWYKKKQGSKTV